MSNPGSQGDGSSTGAVNVQTSVGPYEKLIATLLLGGMKSQVLRDVKNDGW
jgi:hypothetical protein